MLPTGSSGATTEGITSPIRPACTLPSVGRTRGPSSESAIAMRTIHILFALSFMTRFANAATTIEYDFTSEQAQADHASIVGGAHVTSTIDGPNFRNVSRLAGDVELSDDDGRTTYFGAFHSTPVNTPLAPEHGDVFAPIVGTIEDERLVVGDSRPGPEMFGLPTRVYTVDYTYAIAVRVAYVFRNKVPNHAHFTFTVADIGVSASALRVAFSRGYGYALCQRADAFTGLPLLIEGTIESASGIARIRVEAVSFKP